ncbi:MAG: helix-turn-helix transcriptional regulator [Thermomicrobiales bacterium]|nr:helix-turn-helix transcriptional regulator [Thermomicrobiales bacterium]
MATEVKVGAPETVCPRFHLAAELIGKKWTGAILRSLQADRCRFTEIAAMVPGLSDRLLSERLKELEHEGIIQRIVTPETPVRIEYRLTEKGEALDEVMDAIGHWAERWVNAPSGACDAHLCDRE